MATLDIVIAIVVIAFIFDFLNGFHDAANSIATVVSTRVLSPGAAVIWSAFFNFVAALFFGTRVAATIGKGMVKLSVVDERVVIAGLGGAIAKAGWGAILFSGWIPTLAFIVLSPAIGLALGWLLLVAVTWIFHRAH